MAAASAPLPAPEAVLVLVSSLADESSIVRDASVSALKEIAPLNPLLVLDCCCGVSRGARRRFVNMAGVFSVMACAARALDKTDVDPALMTKLAKIATAEIITSKELNAEWQRAAASLLVSIGSHVPDLMMEEIFFHMSGPNSALPAMVQILADFASLEALKFTPHLKDVLLRVLPFLGSVKDIQRPIFANAFKCWCEAAWLYIGDFPSHPLLDSDVISFLNSVFELLLRVWASSRDLKVRLSSVEALGQMVGLVSRSQLKAALPRLVPTILDSYRKDQEMIFLASCGLHNLLNACLLSENGPPLLDFEVDLFMAEPFYYGNEGLLPWQNLRFWRDRSMLDPILSKDAIMLPCKGILKVCAMHLPDIWRSRCCLKEIEGFDHSIANETLGACGNLPPSLKGTCLYYFIWQCGEIKTSWLIGDRAGPDGRLHMSIALTT